MFLFIGLVVLIGAVQQSTGAMVTCELDAVNHLSTFSGNSKVLGDDGKILLAEWDPDNEDCKFKLIVKFMGDYQYSTFAVGPHKNPEKYFRYFDFDRYPGQVSTRGWMCKEGCKGPIDTFDYVLQNDNGTVYATVKEIKPGVKYTVESELCAVDGKPKYKLTYDSSAVDSDTLVSLEIDQDFFYSHQTNMGGICAAGFAP